MMAKNNKIFYYRGTAYNVPTLVHQVFERIDNDHKRLLSRFQWVFLYGVLITILLIVLIIMYAVGVL